MARPAEWLLPAECLLSACLVAAHLTLRADKGCNRQPCLPQGALPDHRHLAKLLLRSCADESIDEIAAFLGVGEQVAALTAK